MKNDAALWQRGMEWGKELLAPPPRSQRRSAEVSSEGPGMPA